MKSLKDAQKKEMALLVHAHATTSSRQVEEETTAVGCVEAVLDKKAMEEKAEKDLQRVMCDNLRRPGITNRWMDIPPVRFFFHFDTQLCQREVSMLAPTRSILRQHW